MKILGFHFVFLFLLSLSLYAQINNDPLVLLKGEFSIENCVSNFTKDGSVKTKTGYQYWFVEKDFLDGRTVKMSAVQPHQATHAPHKHPEDEFFFVLEGTAEFYLNGETVVYGPYTSFYCPPNSLHGIRNVGDTELKYLVIKKYEKN